MTTKKIIGFAGILSFMIMFSCTKETTQPNVVKFKVDGVLYEANDIQYQSSAKFVTAANSSFPQYLGIPLADTTGNIVAVNYTLGTGQPQNLYYLDNGFGTGGYQTEYDGSGNLHITEVSSSRVKGTFSAIVKYLGNPSLTKTLTEGEFDVKIN